MKKYILAAFALAAVLSGCAKDELTNGQDATIDVNAPVFYAGFADASSETKTYVNENGHLRWNADDRLTIFVGKTLNTQYAFDGEDGDNAGGFNPIADGGGFVTANPLNANYAVYPYSSTTKISEEGVISLSLPSVQTYGEDSFGRGANTMIAVTQGTDDFYLPFKNVCGYLVVSLYGDATITSVSLEGNNEEKLAGPATVTPSFGGNPSLVMKDTATETITVDCGEGVMLGTTKETATAFWFVVPQTTFSKGITITATSKDGESFQKATSKTITIERNKISTMAALEYEVSPHSGNINFADPAAKYACVAKYDTNGDGEVSIEEAEAATSFSGLFTDWKGVTSFDEIRYFKNVHSINGLFDGCSKLVSITIPENITDLGSYAFNKCSSLTSVNLPSNITVIGNYTFQNCSILSSIDIPSNVSSIGSYAFKGCSSIGSIDLPSILTSIGSYAFSGCSSLTQVVIPNGITSIPNNCFSGCSSLAAIDIPSSVTTLGDNVFSGVGMWGLKLPSTVSSLGKDCFGSITCVLLPSTSPISIQSTLFKNVKAVFVPSKLIEMYKVMTNWSDYSNKILPIEMYKEKDVFMSSSILGTSGAIDMGLSVKWAAYNVGASKPEEYGDYYAWGETETKSNYWSWSMYFDSIDGNGVNFAKYFNGSSKTILDLEDDVAHVKWEGTWRMPTEEEIIELIECCYCKWTKYNGINGCMIYSIKTGNIIFMPAAGRCEYSIQHKGSACWYWSSSFCTGTSFSNAAIHIWFEQDFYTHGAWVRMDGLSVRPVCE